MLYKSLVLLLYVGTLYGADSDDAGYITDADDFDYVTKENERKKRAMDIIFKLHKCAPEGYTLFATGTTKSEGIFVVYKKLSEHTYLLKNFFKKVVEDVPIESVEVQMNLPPCRCVDCNTIQMKFNLRGRTKFLSLTNQKEPKYGVLADEPAILSIHEPPAVRQEAQVCLLHIKTASFVARGLK